MKAQALREERIYRIEAEPERTAQGLKLSDQQIKEAKKEIAQIFRV